MHQINKSAAKSTASDKTAPKIKKIPKTGEAQQIRYTTKEVALISSISEQLQAVDKAGEKIGGLVEMLVTNRGGIGYGDETIKRIAAHPDIHCSEQYLRKCWNLHRLTTAYGDKMSDEHKQVCRSAMFQIARLLDLNEDQNTLLVFIDECIHQTVSRHLSVDEVGAMVSRRLDEFGKLRKKPASKKPKEANIGSKVVATSEGDLVGFADSISYMSDPEKFDVHRISSAETRMGLTRLISELVAISYRLPNGGPNHDLGNILIKKGRELEEIGQQLLEPSHQPEEV